MAELCPFCVTASSAANYFLAAMFGAFVLYMLNRLNNRQPFSLFGAIQLRTDGRPLLLFLDMLISSAIGAGVVVLVVTLGSVQEAATAGLGLTGILSTFGRDA